MCYVIVLLFIGFPICSIACYLFSSLLALVQPLHGPVPGREHVRHVRGRLLVEQLRAHLVVLTIEGNPLLQKEIPNYKHKFLTIEGNPLL